MEIKTPGPVLQPDYLSALLSSIEESVVATDEQFIIQYWNKGAEQIFGYSANEHLDEGVPKL
jgi:PAS domain S-box-containing protein